MLLLGLLFMCEFLIRQTMIIKNINLLFITIALLSSCGYQEGVTISQFTEPYPFNYIGLVSTTANADSIDVYYSVASGSSNEIQHVKVKPPIIIGGHFTNVTFDSTAIRAKQGLKKAYIEHRGRRAIIDYSGSHYMRIVNNGGYPVEYFIVGNHPLKQYNLDNLFAGAAPGSSTAPVSQVVDLLPEVFYKGGPVKYLLFPEQKPTKDMYKVNFDGTLINKKILDKDYYYYKSTDTVVFRGLYSGENVVSTPWSIIQVMDLFRAEYSQSNDTILTISYPGSAYTSQNTRISAGYIKNYNSFKINPLKPQYYGVIPANGELRSSPTVPFITHVNYEYYHDKPTE